jgi:hypothetical protein
LICSTASTFTAPQLTANIIALIIHEGLAMSSSSIECEHRCAQMLSMAMFLQDVSTRTDLFNPKRSSSKPQQPPAIPSSNQPRRDASIDQISQLPDRTI